MSRINPRSFTGPKTEKRRICLMPWSGWQPCLPVRAAPVCVQRTGRRRQVLPCPEQGGADGQVLWVLQ